VFGLVGLDPVDEGVAPGAVAHPAQPLAHLGMGVERGDGVTVGVDHRAQHQAVGLDHTGRPVARAW
jgi:hypothetical protein